MVAKLRKELRKVNQRLYAECRQSGGRHLQAAVDAVRVPGTRILVQPGTYTEEPSLRPPSAECAALAEKPTLSYEEHLACPHARNLVAILGDGLDADGRCDARLCDLQIEGTGARPEDVVFDARSQRHVAIRADRADGIYFRNFTVQHAPDYGIYVIETDGFVIDRMLGRWNDRYAFLTFGNRIDSNNQDLYRFYPDGTCFKPSSERGYEQPASPARPATPCGCSTTTSTTTPWASALTASPATTGCTSTARRTGTGDSGLYPGAASPQHGAP